MSAKSKLKEKWKKCYGWAKKPLIATLGIAAPLGLIMFCGTSAIASFFFDALHLFTDELSSDRLGAYIGGPLTASALVCGLCWALTHEKDIFVSAMDGASDK